MIRKPLTFSPPIIGHRGASILAPENTLVAFTKALQSGAKWVEFDVMLAACGTPIVFHDETLLRTTGQLDKVVDHTYSYLSSLDVGAWLDPIYSGERIPSLDLTMAWLKQTNMLANIEIKPNPGQDVDTVKHAVPIVLKYFPAHDHQFLFSSFSLASLYAIREALPEAHIGLLLHDWSNDWSKHCEALDCTSVNLYVDLATPEHVAEIKQAGYQVLVYTVNSEKLAKQLYGMGVDAVFTDKPAALLAAHL